MQMHESKTNSSTRGSSSASNIKSINSSSVANNSVTSTARSDSNNNTSDTSKKGKKKSNRDRQQVTNDDAKAASVMSNLSSYSLIDDDHIDDQETINVGNLIIDLESDLEKEKIENEQANNINENNHAKFSQKSNTNTNAPSSTSSSTKTAINRTNQTTNQDSKSNVLKSGQKSNSRHLNSNSIATNSSNEVINTNNGHLTARTIFKSSADERGELKMKITRETKPGKNEHKSTNQKSPTSSGVIGGALNRSNSCETEGADNFDPTQSTSISSTKECGTSTSVGTITEPDCLGPCEPGTSVTLEGIVWQETDGGILVVNVTWRGKTYVGALLDCTRHDWAPPRLCDSPASDIDLKASKGVRAKRIVTRSNGNNALDEKNLLQTTGKLRNGKGRRIPSSNEPTPSCSKKQRELPAVEAAQLESNTSQTNASSSEIISNPSSADNENGQQDSISTSSILIDKPGPSSPVLIGCEEPNCSKRYRNMNGLLYHQAHAHGTDNNESYGAQDDSCSSSTKDRLDSKTLKSEPPVEQNTSVESVDRVTPNIVQQESHQPIDDPYQFGQKRHRTPSPESTSKMNKLANSNQTLDIQNASSLPSDPSNLSPVKKKDQERRHSNSSNSYSNNMRQNEVNRQSPGVPSIRQLDNQHNSPVNSGHPSSKVNPSSSKQSNPLQPLPVPTEEGMKPSGTSTGPPPAPHQANCYFNPAFLANTFNPYALPPYFPRGIYDPMTPAPNAALLSRFMSNTMRVPPPTSDSPSRLLSPSMPKSLPFPPFKMDPNVPPPPIPSSSLGGPLPNMSPHMPNPQHPPQPPPPAQVPPLPQIPPPPSTIGGGSPNIRMPSQGDPLLPPTSQTPFLPPTSLGSFLGIPSIHNPLAPLGGPQMPNLVDDALAKQFPRRYS